MTLGITQGTTNRILREVGAWLATQVKPELLPNQLLGCGNYGCVYSIQGDSNIVVKITTDPAEVFFIQTALSLAAWPEDGIVRYYNILQAPDQLYKGRDVFIIWREAAQDVGSTFRVVTTDSPYDMRLKGAALRRLMQFKRYAHELRLALQRAKDPAKLLCGAKTYQDWAREYISEDDWDRAALRDGSFERAKMMAAPFLRFRGAQRVAYLLRACAVTTEFMENEPLLDQVGVALGFYLDRGILLADVHAGNIGKVFRDGYWHEVITDPGHAYDLRPLLTC